MGFVIRVDIGFVFVLCIPTETVVYIFIIHIRAQFAEKFLIKKGR
jgi:hypothetical protein